MRTSKTRVVYGIMLTLLLMNVMAFSFVVVEGEKTTNIQTTTGFESEHLPAGSGSRSLGDGGVACGPWRFDNAREWKDFARVDEDSAELVVGLSDLQPNAYAELNRLVSSNRGRVLNEISVRGEFRTVVVGVPFDLIPAFAEAIKAAGLARYIEPNFRFETQIVPNDPSWNVQWGPKKIEADWAWNTTTGSPSVLVAVVDTGIDWDHPDLVANYVALGYDWVNMDSDPMDDQGHGTHCAGIIAATLNNELGIAGLAQVQIMAEKGLDYRGNGYDDDLANAIIHATDQGADIISMSWGGPLPSSLIYDAIKYAYDRGVLLIAAAGNSGTCGRACWPAGFDEVIAVSATDRYDNRAWWSNFGDWVELAAPGVDIYSTVWDNSYTYKSGTSMAAPHVSGVAALVWSRFPTMTRDEVQFHLEWTADDLGDPGFDINYGYGRVNARKAVELTRPIHDLSVERLKSPPYLEPGDQAIVNSTIFNYGTSDESDITVQFLVNGSLADSVPVSSLTSLNSTKVSVPWTSLVAGTFNLTFYVVPVSGEALIENNARSSSVLVLVVPRILIVAADYALWLDRGTSLPEFESALTAAGYDYLVWKESTMGGVSLEFLLKFSLIIWTSGDYFSGAVNSIDAVTLEAYSAQGGNILLEGEDIGFDHEGDSFMVNVAHAIYQIDGTEALGLTVTDPAHPVTRGLPSSFQWLTGPPYDDGVTPTNGGFEVIRYTGTSWTAVTVFDGTGTGNGSVVYYAFPAYSLAQPERDNLIINSVSWLLPVGAYFTYSPGRPMPGQVVTFNASQSALNGGIIISYEWDFGDTNTASTTNPIITHTYTTLGNYNVALTVTGSEGQSDTTLTMVRVYAFITPGDVNGDGVVDIADYSRLSAHWYPGPPQGPLGYDSTSDINGDGRIDIADAGIVSAYWTGPPKGPLAP